MSSDNPSTRVELSDSEPQFLFFRRDRDEVPTVDEVWDDEYEIVFDPTEEEPDETIRGYDDAMEFLETSDDPYLWVESNQETAPIISVCSTCSAKVQTNSKERLDSKRNVHHISTGH